MITLITMHVCIFLAGFAAWNYRTSRLIIIMSDTTAPELSELYHLCLRLPLDSETESEAAANLCIKFESKVTREQGKYFVKHFEWKFWWRAQADSGGEYSSEGGGQRLKLHLVIRALN